MTIFSPYGIINYSKSLMIIGVFMESEIEFKSSNLYFGDLTSETIGVPLGAARHSHSVDGVHFIASSSNAVMDVEDLIVTIKFRDGGIPDFNKIVQVLVEDDEAIFCSIDSQKSSSIIIPEGLGEYVNVLPEGVLFKVFSNNSVNFELDFTLDEDSQVIQIVIVRVGK